MKKSIPVLLALLVLGVVLVANPVRSQTEQKPVLVSLSVEDLKALAGGASVQPGDQSFGFGTSINRMDLIGTSVLPIYFATGTIATTTNAFQVGGGEDSINVNMYALASSSTSNIKFQYEFSYDGNVWFGEDVKSTSGSTVTHQTASTTHSWIPGTTEPTGRNIGVQNLDTNWFRIRVFRGANSFAAANNFRLWVEGITKNTY